MCKFAKTNSAGAALRRAAIAGGLAASLLLTALTGASAQTPNDAGTNPIPYSWSGFHAGGTFPDPFIGPTTATANGPLTYANTPNPLYSQLQGTPAGFDMLTAGALNGTSTITEIPSFLLGNYSLTTGPSVGVTVANLNYFPNHFRDDQTVLSWSAPFTFLTPPTSIDTSITADNADTTAQTYGARYTPNTTTLIDPSGWKVLYIDPDGTNTWATQSSGTASQSGANPPAPATATIPDYRRVVATNATTGLATATWTFTVPDAAANPSAPGLYTVTLHLPDPDTTGVERRITDAHYVITVDTTKVFDGRVTQTETNGPQYLAGPFALKAGQKLTVTLDNSTQTNLTTIDTTQTNYYVLADSVSLTSGAFAGAGSAISGTPTAINATQYPEIADALYYGFTIVRDTNTGIATGQMADNVNPYGNTTVGGTSYVGTTGAGAGITDHAIRQLVYYGRYETVVLTDALGNLVDANGNTTATPVTEQVGAIYCVNGINGDVVWRFQTPDKLDLKATNIGASQAVYSTPVVARVNVLVPGGTAGTYTPTTKLVVIIADDNGMVYCLDALGNRNGTANTNAVSTAYNQPIYNPTAPFDTAGVGVAQGTAGATIVYHVGTTTPYWIYRPNAAKAAYASANIALPIPQAFGLASPTVYINPNVTTDPTSLAPGKVSTATLTTNATVYLGNSNGTLYALDGLGAKVTVPAPLTAAGPDAGTGDKYDTSNYIGIRSFQTAPAAGTVPATIFNYNSVPTPTPLWWFAVNGTVTNTADQTGTVSITSAPAIRQTAVTAAIGTTPTLTAPTIYFTTANDTNNIGRVYALPGTGPANATAGTTPNYNNVARPTWSFPNAYRNTGTGPAANKIRPALGSISGSPVVFTNPDDRTTHIYVAANSTEDQVAPADTGRIWSINTDGTVNWAYPQANDPNDPTKDNATQPAAPIGSFQYATPAIGVVGFPANLVYGQNGGSTYTHADGFHTTNISGQNVPMLYVGSNTEADDSSNFYALDLDGTTDDQRNIFAFGQTMPPVGFTASPTGFQSSPILIVNHATTGTTAQDGPNGGSVFITGSNNNLYQLSATFTSDSSTDASSISPQFPIFGVIPGFGPFSSLAAASFDANTLGAAPATGVTRVVDWVYGGNGKLGTARGISVSSTNLGGSGAFGLNYGSDGPGVDTEQATLSPLQLPLHAYIFNGTTNNGYDTNLGNADKIGATLPAFEWGQPVYIRLSNVVPPNNAVLSNGTLTSSNDTLFMHDDSLAAADPGRGVIYTNGGPITVQLTDIANPGNPTAALETDSVTIPALLLGSLGSATQLPGNGFIKATGPGEFDDGNHGDVLRDTTSNLWIGAGTYAIGDGSNRKNTPGARRRIASATQIAQAYRPTATGYTFIGSVTLQISVDSTANAVTRFDATGKPVTTGLQRIPVEDQPTFGILNPLAVQGGGYPLALGANAPKPTPTFLGAIPIPVVGNGIIGPFGATHTGAALTVDDLGAYANGNRIPRATTDIPKNGVVAGGRGARRNQDRRLVITATGDINHGTTGDNADPLNINSTPPTGNQGIAKPGYLAPNPAYPNAQYGPYALNVADRSALGAAGQQIHNLTVQAAALAWHDNSAFGGSNVYGPGAMVNPLPWETEPTAGQAGTNTSLDYPDIGASRLSHVLMPFPGYTGATPATGGEITNQAGSLDPALGATADKRTVYADPLQVQVRVPTYQPANLQVYDQTNTTSAQTTPDQLTATSVAFPEGYVTNETVYVDSNHNRKFDPGEAYRTFRVFTGVPVAMSTTMDTATIDLGRLPQGFGLDTDAYPALGAFMPYPTATQLGVNAQNPGYVQFFKPLHVSNRGNVNLLNVHLDQKVRIGTRDTPLPFRSDSLDLAAQLPAYDAGATLTGPRPVLPNTAGTPTGDGFGTFLLRSSLDDDLIRAYGRNPALVNDTNYSSLGATFHKARVGDPAPSVLTVPDVPRDNTNGYSGYIDAQNPMVPPVAIGNILAMPGSVNSAGAGPATPTAAEPFIALTIPQGTPVGTYTQSVRLFEGVDPSGYKDIKVNGNNYVPILPPQYGNHQINPVLGNPMGYVAYTPPLGDDYNGNGLINTWMLNTDGSPLQPASSAAVIKATVTEGRITDGASKGSLPQVDQQGANAGTGGARLPAADFLPSAFRDPASGNVSLYWTSSRGATATSPYTLVGANLSFKNGYFSPVNPMGNWWMPIGASLAPAAGLNSSISAFTGDGGTYAFVQNVTGGGTTPVVNNLLCYPVTAQSGALTGTAVPVSQNTSQSSFGAHGLVFDVNKFAGVTKGFPDAYPNTTQSAITNNVWGFWYGGARGRSAIYYSSALSSKIDGYSSGNASPFNPAIVLPVPAGLASVSDPNAVLSYAPDPAGGTQPVPVIEVTYTGIAADGNADIYVSRYRPYYVRKSDNTTLATDANGNNIVSLALLPSPTITEQLQGTDGNLYYQARDVAWASPFYTPKTGGGFTVANSVDVSVNGTGLNLINAQPKLDRATNTLVYANVTLPNVGGKATSGLGTVYIDLARGRVRFSPQYPTASGASVYAVFNAQARRITTDSRADTAPVSFIDTALKQNEANIKTNGVPNGIPDVEADRYWYIWRKSGAPGTSTTPTLYYKTQRLTVSLHDANNQPISIQLTNSGTTAAPVYKPNVTVTDAAGNVLYTPATGGEVDVDWSRGRLYFPVIDSNGGLEGRSVTVKGNDSNGKAINPTSDTIHWLDEPRYNDKTNPTTAAGTSPTGQTAFTATATGDAAIPIDTVVNESNVTAFLDPKQPHKVWLFWNSTRNGTADLYYETISPLFSATTGN